MTRSLTRGPFIEVSQQNVARTACVFCMTKVSRSDNSTPVEEHCVTRCCGGVYCS